METMLKNYNDRQMADNRAVILLGEVGKVSEKHCFSIAKALSTPISSFGPSVFLPLLKIIFYNY